MFKTKHGLPRAWDNVPRTMQNRDAECEKETFPRNDDDDDDDHRDRSVVSLVMKTTRTLYAYTPWCPRRIPRVGGPSLIVVISRRRAGNGRFRPHDRVRGKNITLISRIIPGNNISFIRFRLMQLHKYVHTRKRDFYTLKIDLEVHTVVE